VSSEADAALLKIDDLRLAFATEAGPVLALDGVSFELLRGETLGVVGESGCGKSVTALSVMRLISTPPGKYLSGSICFEGRDLRLLSEREMRDIRGDRISMVFQEPMTSLNPVLRVGEQIAEAVRLHQGLGPGGARARTVEMLREVGIPSPEQNIDKYPHELSGGMRQRVMIAMAMSCRPRLLIADEPTTAVDVTIEAQILELMDVLKQETGTSVMLVTHDLGIVAQHTERVVVMYLGQVAEVAPTPALFRDPAHPYTQGLLDSLPKPDSTIASLRAIEGSVPDPLHRPAGCPFHPRCPRVMPRCRSGEPPTVEVGRGHTVRCWLWEKR
jgi:oligopeptide/dipeptide ABC transporter ATP-binding protein